jgi:Tfp pilus assembly protein PilF
MRLSTRSIVLLLLGAAAACALMGGGFYAWRSYAMAAQEQRSYESIQKFLAESRPLEALAIIKTMRGVDPGGYLEKWMPLEITALEQSRNITRLLYLYGQYPLEVLKNEKASVLVARTLLATRNTIQYMQVRNSWLPREKSPELWLALDADVLIMNKKLDDAARLLSSRTFKGPADAGRLTRLAMLASTRSVDEAWDLLEQAYRADPRNPDVRSFRAQILESGGNVQAARVEYVAALLCDPKNPMLRDQLAEFYRRQGSYPLALQTWKEGLSQDSPDYLWIKPLFWAKVAQRAPIPRYRPSTGTEEMAPLIKQVQGLKPGVFWNARAAEEDASLQRLADGRQEIFWLSLIQLLRNGSEDRATAMLEKNPYRRASFDPDLERALTIILTYRKWGVLVTPAEELSPHGHSRKLRHQFFEELELFAGKHKRSDQIPPQLDALLRSPDAFAAAFLAAGWLEAALGLDAFQTVPANLPDWLAYGLTQAHRYARGDRNALEYAQKQTPNPALELLKGEILLADGQIDRAVPKLVEMSKQGADIGFRASWLLSLAMLGKGDFEGAARAVDGNAAFSGSLAGKEIRARIACAKGDLIEADRLYGLIADQSLEAETYLARRAYEKKDYAVARKYTEDLVRNFPDTLEFRENLAKISKAEHGN